MYHKFDGPETFLFWFALPILAKKILMNKLNPE